MGNLCASKSTVLEELQPENPTVRSCFMAMDNLTTIQPTVLQLQPDNLAIPVKPSLLHDDMITSLILPYFQVNELIRAEFISWQFRNFIIKFYCSIKTFNYKLHNKGRNWRVEGLINKVLTYMPNINCFELHSVASLQPLSKLNLLQKLHTIRLTGEVNTAEFIAFASSLKSMAKNLHILDFGKLKFTPVHGIPDQNFFDDFIMLKELHVISVFCPYLPNMTLPKLSVFECGPYFSVTCYCKCQLLDQFCHKNLQIEELIIKCSCDGTIIQRFPSSTFAVFRNLKVLHASGYSIDGIMAKSFIESCQNVTKLSLDMFFFESDDVMQIIFDGLSDTLVQLKLENMVNIKPSKAIQGIYKLQKLQHLVLRCDTFKNRNSVDIDDLLVLKSLRVLHLEAILLKFTSNCSTLKFSLLEELEFRLISRDNEHLKILDFCTDGLKTLSIIDFSLTNKDLLQLCDNFPNLANLKITIDETATFDTLKRLIGAFSKLRCLKIPDISIKALLAFVQNCKFLSTIATGESAADVLRNHPSIKIIRNCGRYITIDDYV